MTAVPARQPSRTYSRADRPYCDYGKDGTVIVKDYDGVEIMRLTLAAAEEMAEVIAVAAALGRSNAAPQNAPSSSHAEVGE